MSFKLSSFSQRLSGAKKVGVDREGAAAGTNAGETKEGEAAKPGVNKPRRKVKQNIILAAKTDIYVDDEDYCKPTFSRTERLEYWTHLLSNKGKKQMPVNHKSWVTKELKTENGSLNYPVFYVFILNYIKSNKWDHLYINMFIIFLLLVIAFEDEWVDTYAPVLADVNADGILYIIIIVVMLVSQVIPSVGILYYINRCNDLTKYTASVDFPAWAFSCTIIAQSVEFFFYGGQGREDRAGKCRIVELDEEQFDPEEYSRKLRRRSSMFLSCIKFFRREAQVDVGPFDASALNASYDDAVTDVNASPEIDAGAEADIENQLVSQSEKKKKKKKRSKKGKEDDRERATSDSEEEVLADKAGKLTRTKSGRSSKKSKRKSIATSDSENDMNNTSEDKIVSDDLIESGNDDEGQSSRRKSRKSSRKSGKSSKSIKGKRMSASERSRKRAQDYEDDEEEAPEVEEVKEVVVKIEMLEWTCIVCGTFSNLPRHPTIDTDVVFGEKGVHYKRTYAHILFGRDMPKCAKCYTYADYKPPLGSAHLFRHNPELYKGYSDYPHKPTVQTGFPSDKSIRSRLVRGKGYCQSFFCGMHDNYNSYAIQNDWRLKKYVFDGFPEIPRVVLTPGDFYCVGEIIECKLQKTDWARAKITEVHSNHTYNIRYDPGDELRYVLESSLRSRPEKRAYVYRVEQCMLLIVVLLPIGLLGMVTGQPSLLALGLMISMTILFSIRCVTMIQYFYNYYAAGLLKILAIHTFYTLPIFFLWIGSIIGMANGSELSTWTTVVVLIIMGKIFSLPILYMMRPAFALISMVLFLFSSAGLFLTAEYVAGSSPFPYIAIPIGPLIILLLLIKYLRKHLHNVWDVCLVIRPKIDISYTNPSIFLTIRNWLC